MEMNKKSYTKNDASLMRDIRVGFGCGICFCLHQAPLSV